jgi:hypothetical protein
MNTTREPATAPYHTHVHAITRPDGSTTTRPEEEEPVVVEAVDEHAAAQMAAWAFISAEMPGKPVGYVLHVHVIGPRPGQTHGPAGCWTVDVYIDTAAPTLH